MASVYALKDTVIGKDNAEHAQQTLIPQQTLGLVFASVNQLFIFLRKIYALNVEQMLHLILPEPLANAQEVINFKEVYVSLR